MNTTKKSEKIIFSPKKIMLISKVLKNSFKFLSSKYLFHALIFTILTLVLIFSLHHPFNHDELEHLHTTWKIFSGEKIYIDFFQNHNPLLYLTLYPIFMLSKDSLWTIYLTKLFIYLIFLLILFYTYKIGKRIFTEKTAKITIILLSTSLLFVSQATSIRPEVPMVLCCLLSIEFLLNYLDSKSHLGM